MNANYEIAEKITLNLEGYISNDKNDTGGYTIFGISSKVYPQNVARMKKWIKEGRKDLALSEAKKIYYEEYWIKAGCNNYPLPMALVIFDTSINSGVGTAKKIYKRCYGDWKYYLMERVVFFTKCKTEKYHLRGWTHRIARLYEKIIAMKL